MSGGWAGSNRRDTLPPNWQEIRTRILRRDMYRCTAPGPDGLRCPRMADQVDHVVPAFEGGTDDDSNLASLCEPHHSKKSAAEGVRALRAKKAAQKRPAPRSVRDLR